MRLDNKKLAKPVSNHNKLETHLLQGKKYYCTKINCRGNRNESEIILNRVDK
jgi:hypothetical protein